MCVVVDDDDVSSYRRVTVLVPKKHVPVTHRSQEEDTIIQYVTSQ